MNDKLFRFLNIIGVVLIMAVLFDPFINGFYQISLLIASDVPATDLSSLKSFFIVLFLIVLILSIAITTLFSVNWLNVFLVLWFHITYVLIAMIPNVDFVITMLSALLFYSLAVIAIRYFLNKSKNAKEPELKPMEEGN